MMSDLGAESITDQEERNKSLVDWSTAILTIFWSIWWIHVADKVLQSDTTIFNIFTFTIPSGWIPIIMAVYVAFFSYEYIRWMWLARKIQDALEVGIFFRIMRRFLGAVISVLALAYYLNSQVTQIKAYCLFGSTMTICWVIVIVAALINSRKWDVK